MNMPGKVDNEQQLLLDHSSMIKCEIVNKEPDIKQEKQEPDLKQEMIEQNLYPEQNNFDLRFKDDRSQHLKTEPLEDESQEVFSENCPELFFKEECLEPLLDHGHVTFREPEGTDEFVKPVADALMAPTNSSTIKYNPEKGSKLSDCTFSGELETVPNKISDQSIKKYKNMSSLVKHMKFKYTHSEERCSLCQYSCKSNRDLRQHMRHAHCDERPFRCSHCQYSSKTKDALRKHLQRVHSEETPFSCFQCQYSCKNKGSLRKHMIQVHFDGKLLNCSQCQYSCKKKGTLTTHMKRIHSDSHLYSCDQCEFSCKTRCDLKSHKDDHLAEVRPFKCLLCQFCSTAQGPLTFHMNKFHSDEKYQQILLVPVQLIG